MKNVLILAALALGGLLAACSTSTTATTSQRTVLFQDGKLVLHAPGQPDAHVSADGDLRIGGNAIAVSEPQRQLLRRYYRQANAVAHSGVAIGKRSVETAVNGLGSAIDSIFHGDPSAASKKMEMQVQGIDVAADKLCADIKALDTTRNAVALQVPAFEPYAAGNAMHCSVTRTVTIRDDGKVTSSTATLPPAATPGPRQP